MSYLVNKKIFITGGTGSLGKALIKKLLKLKARPIIYSRDEGKQALCFNNGENVKKIIFVISLLISILKAVFTIVKAIR